MYEFYFKFPQIILRDQIYVQITLHIMIKKRDLLNSRTILDHLIF